MYSKQSLLLLMVCHLEPVFEGPLNQAFLTRQFRFLSFQKYIQKCPEHKSRRTLLNFAVLVLVETLYHHRCHLMTQCTRKLMTRMSSDEIFDLRLTQSSGTCFRLEGSSNDVSKRTCSVNGRTIVVDCAVGK